MAKLIIMDTENTSDSWWEAARAVTCPVAEAVPLIDDPNIDRVVLSDLDAARLMEWAESLPGFSEGPESAETCLQVYETNGDGADGLSFYANNDEDGVLWIVYHREESGKPALHLDKGGPWYYQPADASTGEVWSAGFPSAAKALEAMHEEMNSEPSEEPEPR